MKWPTSILLSAQLGTIADSMISNHGLGQGSKYIQKFSTNFQQNVQQMSPKIFLTFNSRIWTLVRNKVIVSSKDIWTPDIYIANQVLDAK